MHRSMRQGGEGISKERQEEKERGSPRAEKGRQRGEAEGGPGRGGAVVVGQGDRSAGGPGAPGTVCSEPCSPILAVAVLAGPSPPSHGHLELVSPSVLEEHWARLVLTPTFYLRDGSRRVFQPQAMPTSVL